MSSDIDKFFELPCERQPLRGAHGHCSLPPDLPVSGLFALLADAGVGGGCAANAIRRDWLASL